MARLLKIPESKHSEPNAEMVKAAVARLRCDVVDLLNRSIPFGTVSVEVEVKDGRITAVRPTVSQDIRVQSVTG